MIYEAIQKALAATIGDYGDPQRYLNCVTISIDTDEYGARFIVGEYGYDELFLDGETDRPITPGRGGEVTQRRFEFYVREDRVLVQERNADGSHGWGGHIASRLAEQIRGATVAGGHADVILPRPVDPETEVSLALIHENDEYRKASAKAAEADGIEPGAIIRIKNRHSRVSVVISVTKVLGRTDDGFTIVSGRRIKRASAAIRKANPSWPNYIVFGDRDGVYSFRPGEATPTTEVQGEAIPGA